MSIDDEKIVVDELGEMVALAEASTSAIDAGQKVKINSQFYIIAASIIFIFLLSLVFVFSDRYLVQQNLGLNISEGLRSGTLILLLVGIGGSLFRAFREFIQLRNTVREIRVEIEIQREVLSLIDQQIARAERTTRFSPVARATVNMRLKRLDRTSHKNAGLL